MSRDFSPDSSLVKFRLDIPIEKGEYSRQTLVIIIDGLSGTDSAFAIDAIDKQDDKQDTLNNITNLQQ